MGMRWAIQKKTIDPARSSAIADDMEIVARTFEEMAKEVHWIEARSGEGSIEGECGEGVVSAGRRNRVP